MMLDPTAVYVVDPGARNEFGDCRFPTGTRVVLVPAGTVPAGTPDVAGDVYVACENDADECDYVNAVHLTHADAVPAAPSPGTPESYLAAARLAASELAAVDPSPAALLRLAAKLAEAAS